MALFRKSESKDAPAPAKGRAPRVSSGWRDVLAHLKANEGQRVLDFGITSPANINFLTGLGHSVYAAQAMQDAERPEWMRPGPDGKPVFDAEGFAAEHFSFSGKTFDVVLLWDSVNYMPAELAGPLFARLHDALRPGGMLLAFFHGAMEGPQAAYVRYQLADSPELAMVQAGDHRLQHVVQVRQVERWLEGFATTRFFLGKDNIRELIAVR